MISSVFLAAVCAILVNGEGTGILQNETPRRENRDDLTNLHLHPSPKALEHIRQKDVLLSKEDTLSNLPQVAFMSKPQEPVTPNNGGKKRRKGKGKKRDPCLGKYKDYCIHGKCKYIKKLKSPSCICQEDYHGERCHALSLPVENRFDGYDRTTILAVTAVILSSLCLIIIAVLLMLRCHKQGVYDVENEEKVKLGITVNQ
ncbi:proheparin-binding EGF-like growth factor [Ahaetulla prasina]|uniref:proheparin-binding EGF-like growth factor n=1 Tax=Ahaetulla prasina TaxID=499056 RepID=UPI00264A15CA|nr:proheparin-binding EGF-like growth factor [Ahaetulla prasina]XP_058032011.1 proheparin-binding EGF-like growth factor [Ahaetulla prasina]